MDDEGNLRVRKDDLAYNMMRMWQGAVGRAPEDGMVSPAYVVLAPKSGTIPAFFEHWFKRSRSLYLLWAYSHGLTSDRLRLYFRDFAKVPMTLPGSDEQQKIADLLGAIDTRIALLTRKASALRRYKREVARRLFARELRFRREDGSAFPDWQTFALGAVLDWKPTNSLSRDKLSSAPGKVQNIHYGDIHTRFSGRFRQSKQPVPYIAADRDAAGIKQSAFCEVGDLVIADASEDYSDIGKAIEILEAAPHSLVAGLHTHLARPKSGLLALGFGGYLLQSTVVRRSIMRAAQGISVLGISKTEIEKIRVDLPDVDEQRRIAAFLFELDDKIEGVGSKISAMQTFKKGLLQQMFV
jgi:type I restriction enzyme, S subunit